MPLVVLLARSCPEKHIGFPQVRSLGWARIENNIIEAEREPVWWLDPPPFQYSR
jgi:hypothetical protein